MANAGFRLPGRLGPGKDSVAAAEMAVSSPLFKAVAAPTACCSDRGGSDLGLFEIDEAAACWSPSSAHEGDDLRAASRAADTLHCSSGSR